MGRFVDRCFQAGILANLNKQTQLVADQNRLLQGKPTIAQEQQAKRQAKIDERDREDAAIAEAVRKLKV